MDKKPGLAIILSQAMKNKKSKMEPEESYSDDSEELDHLKEISRDLLDAVKADDAEAVAMLLKEAFECCESAPHDEASDEEM